MTSDSRNTILQHKPVMVSEVMSHLVTDLNGIYIDGTIGLGGHSKIILSSLNKGGHLIGIDRDSEALAIAEKNLSPIGPNYSLYNKSYAETDLIEKEYGAQTINGILLDLGLSSAQLNNQARGFTFNGSGSLDMRFNNKSGNTAEQILSSKTETEIADLIYMYSDERYSRKIAFNIKRAERMVTVEDLREAIRLSTPPNKRNRTFARVFQAIRIIVNDELNQLDTFLDKFFRLLCNGGRIVIISYHSLEDRLVKLTFKKLKAEGQFSILTKRPLIPTDNEVIENSRSRSAKLRVWRTNKIVAKQKSKFNPRKQRQFLRSIIPFTIVLAAISGLIAYLWISSEVDETLNELEVQQSTVIELNNDIGNLKDDIEYLERVDILTARAKKELDMVFTAPETIAIYVDKSTITDD